MIGEEQGQSLIIVMLALFAIVAIAAYAVDVANWYSKHHQAQLAADASALAAANCLAMSPTPVSTGSGTVTCSTSIDTASATAAASDYGLDNGVTIPAGNVSFTSSTVTVKAPNPAPPIFAGVIGLGTVAISAQAVAAIEPGGTTFSCSSSGSDSCISLFAANTNCPSSSSMTAGLDLVTNDSGGGNTSVPYAYSNSYYFNGGASGASSYGVTIPGTKSGGPTCATSNEKKKNTTTFTYTSGQVPYPAVWTQPKCNASNTAFYWTTSNSAPTANQITTPGVYCVTSPPMVNGSPGCTEGANGMTQGYIDVDETSSLLTAGGAYEFVSPCVTLAGTSSAKITALPGQPLVYGTASIVTAATSTALPTCTAASNAGTAGTDLFIDGNGAQIVSPIFDQCGTAELTQNNDFLGYIEAWNIIVDKNNTVTGNGPTSPGGGGTTTTPPHVSLVG